MSQTTSKTNTPIWEAETLRLTCFQSPIAQIENEPNWWTELVGESPEKRESQPKRGISQEEGEFENGRLILKVEPTRIDWVFTKGSDNELGGFSFIETQHFNQAMLKWLKMCPPVVRLAF